MCAGGLPNYWKGSPLHQPALFCKMKVLKIIIYSNNDCVFAKGNLDGWSISSAKRGNNFASGNAGGFFPKEPMKSIRNKFSFQNQAKLSGKESLALAPNSPQLSLIFEKNTCIKIEQTHKRRQGTLKWMEEWRSGSPDTLLVGLTSHGTHKKAPGGQSILTWYHFIYMKPGTLLAHYNHEMINVINLNNASLWEYKTVLLSRYFHTH